MLSASETIGTLHRKFLVEGSLQSLEVPDPKPFLSSPTGSVRIYSATSLP